MLLQHTNFLYFDLYLNTAQCPHEKTHNTVTLLWGMQIGSSHAKLRNNILQKRKFSKLIVSYRILPCKGQLGKQYFRSDLFLCGVIHVRYIVLLDFLRL